MSYINLEDEDLINADEDELRVEEDGLLPSDNEDNDNNIENSDAADPNTTSNAIAKAASTKRVVRNPQPKLNPERLRGPKGLIILESWFKDIELKGKGHEKEDLDAVLSRLEQWTHQLFPKYTFDDMLQKIESLGHKNQINYYLKRIRMGEEDESMMSRPDDIPSDDEGAPSEQNTDPFDSLLSNNPSSTPVIDQNHSQSQAPQTQPSTLTEEQRQRIARNRLIAEERRLARMNAQKEELARQQEEQARDELSQIDETIPAAMEIDGF